jgi:hypothetical protein
MAQVPTASLQTTSTGMSVDMVRDSCVLKAGGRR